MVGGDPDLTSVSVWTSQDFHCVLPSLPRDMYDHSVDYVLGKIIACYEVSCDQLTPSGWSHFSYTVQDR